MLIGEMAETTRYYKEDLKGVSIVCNLEYFLAFDQVILYYDNGQRQLSNLLLKVFGEKLTNMYRKLPIFESYRKLFVNIKILWTFCPEVNGYHYCDRENTKTRNIDVRIISARPADKQEIAAYNNNVFGRF